MDDYNYKKRQDYTKVKNILNIIIVGNLNKLLDLKSISQRQLFELLEERKVSVTRERLNQILKWPDKHTISVTLLLGCCDLLGVTVEDLVSEEFDPRKYEDSNIKKKQEYLDINRLTVRCKSLKIESQESKKDLNIFPEFLETTNLIIDPKNTQFDGYLQKYYCYYYPTHSSEHKIIKGTLTLTPEEGHCKAILEIDTNTVDDEGKANYKKYIGYAVISVSVNSVNCIMYGEPMGEYCFLMFRHFKLNFRNQDCRIAEVLSSSSAAEDRRPTVLRMLLSREEINDKDLELISPAFSLNYSTIIVNEGDLLKVAKQSNIYKNIVDRLLKEKEANKTFFYKENDVYNLALKYLNNSKEETLEFLMHIRKYAFSYRYNKVSKKADEAVRSILLAKGYYKK